MPLRVAVFLASLPSSSCVSRRTVRLELAYKEATIARQEGPKEGIRHSRRRRRYRRGRQTSGDCWGRLGRQVKTVLNRPDTGLSFVCSCKLTSRHSGCALYASRFWCSKAPIFARLFSDTARWSTKPRWALSWLANSTRPSCGGRSQRLLVSGEPDMHAVQSAAAI